MKLSANSKTILCTVLFSLCISAAVSAGQNVTLKKPISSSGNGHSWLNVNAVGLIEGTCVDVTTALKGKGCQLTRENNFGELIYLQPGTRLSVSDKTHSVVKTEVCKHYTTNGGGDDVCAEFGTPVFSAVLTKTITTGDERFTLSCEVPDSQSLEAAQRLYENSTTGL